LCGIKVDINNSLKMQDEIKVREKLYQAIISQLQNDGYMAIAKNLILQVKPVNQCSPSDKLYEMFLQNQDQMEKQNLSRSLLQEADTGTGIDLEFDTDVQILSPQAFFYETCYVTSHKAPCRAAAFSSNGLYIATGSVDTSIKVLDVERMLAKSTSPADLSVDSQQGDHPVIRTLYDHSDEVTCLDFHPTQQIIVSGSRDYTVKVFDYSKSSAKRSSKCINEVAQIRSIALNPTGEYLLVGTQHHVLRLYDLETSSCFVSANPNDQHKAAINSIAFSPRGNLFTSGSQDGCIKIWDGRSCKNIRTYQTAHGGDPVSSVRFSRNGKYVLSSGKDSIARLWDLSIPGRPIQEYTGAHLGGKQEHRTQAVFNHTEDYVFFANEHSIAMCCWCSRTGERKHLLSLGHQGPARRIAHSPTAPAFISCSEDHRARFWYKKIGSE